MGNENGRPTGKLGISALATVSLIEKNHIESMRTFFRESSRKGDPRQYLPKSTPINLIRPYLQIGNCDQINRDDLKEALTGSDLLEPDLEILDKLFTMFDDTGEQLVYYSEFVAACCLLTTGSPSDKILLVFESYDRTGTGTITRGDVRKSLQAMNQAACYFGDPALTDEEIVDMLSECYKKANTSIAQVTYRDFVPFVIETQTFFKFVCALGSRRYVK